MNFSNDFAGDEMGTFNDVERQGIRTSTSDKTKGNDLTALQRIRAKSQLLAENKTA